MDSSLKYLGTKYSLRLKLLVVLLCQGLQGTLNSNSVFLKMDYLLVQGQTGNQALNDRGNDFLINKTEVRTAPDKTKGSKIHTSRVFSS